MLVFGDATADDFAGRMKVATSMARAYRVLKTHSCDDCYASRVC